MGYTTPVIDRTNADIIARNSKAFMNVADWTRIYRNAQLASSLSAIELDEIITFDILPTPTITYIPRVSFLNTLLANIERTRLAMSSLIPTLTEIKDDWEGGAHKVSPNYQYVNLWEKTIDVIWDHWNGDSLEVCPNLSADVVVSSGQTKIYVDCVNTNGHSITVDPGGVMHVI